MWVVLALGTAACGPDEVETTDAIDPADTATTTAIPTPAPAGNVVRVADIVGSPDQYLGQTVTVEAEVEEVHGPMAFSLDEDAPVAGGIDNDFLVFSPQAAQLAAIDDQWLNNKVRVTGIVRRVTVIELERELGWDLDPSIESEIEATRPVLVASSLERVTTP